MNAKHRRYIYELTNGDNIFLMRNGDSLYINNCYCFRFEKAYRIKTLKT